MLFTALADPAEAGGTLTVGMTAGDIPVTTGNPDQGFEGYRFVGYNLYDALLLWDLSKADKPSEIKPGLATSYEIDPGDHKRWIVHLRQGVTWHDGCKFTADDVEWNYQYRTDQKAPFFLAQQFAYSVPLDCVKRVKAVYAFDPSPVTGFFSVMRRLRNENKKGLLVDRIYERGEILALLRSLMSLFYRPSTTNAAIRGVRYWLFLAWNPIAAHSIVELAAKIDAARRGT